MLRKKIISVTRDSGIVSDNSSGDSSPKVGENQAPSKTPLPVFTARGYMRLELELELARGFRRDPAFDLRHLHRLINDSTEDRDFSLKETLESLTKEMTDKNLTYCRSLLADLFIYSLFTCKFTLAHLFYSLSKKKTNIIHGKKN